MNKSLIAALVASMALMSLPALASSEPTSASGQTAVTAGPPVGTLVAQSNDSDNQSSQDSNSNSSSSSSDDHN